MHSKRSAFIKALLLIPIFLSACAGATSVPTSAPPRTAAPTAEVTNTIEATETSAATAAITGTAEGTGTVEVTGTAEGTGTVEATGTAEMTGTTTTTETPAATSEATGTVAGTEAVTSTPEAGGTAVMTGTTGAMTSTMDLVQTAMSSTSFSVLVRALTAAGMVDVLKQAGPYTVFVPSDEAFAKMPASTLNSLLNDKQQLTDLLSYHVVPGRLTAADLANQTTLKTLNGKDLRVRVEDGVVYINDAKVVQSDVQATNGVIHVIDTVMIPPTQ
jgi:uncharacterized surface protein with fasciclin (FAS1) repeats